MSATVDISTLSPLEKVELLRRCAPIYRAALKQYEHLYAYAIQAGENGPIKIGVAKTPWERLKTLQTGNHEELRGLAAWRVLPWEEAEIHEEFGYARIRGEWFRPVPELVEFVLAQGGIFCDWERPVE